MQYSNITNLMAKPINNLNHIGYHPALRVSVENGIKFSNLKHLNIKNLPSKFENPLYDFIRCSFPSNLESLSFKNSNIYNKREIMSAIEKLRIKDAKITFIDCFWGRFIFRFGWSLMDVITIFWKANTVCFDQWRLSDKLFFESEEFYSEKPKIKNLLFAKCSFDNIESSKEMITRLGLDKKIENITFDENCTDRMKH